MGCSKLSLQEHKVFKKSLDLFNPPSWYNLPAIEVSYSLHFLVLAFIKQYWQARALIGWAMWPGHNRNQ
jgi:hypothetical protein